jgi:hypothetical protein
MVKIDNFSPVSPGEKDPIYHGKFLVEQKMLYWFFSICFFICLLDGSGRWCLNIRCKLTIFSGEPWRSDHIYHGKFLAEKISLTLIISFFGR